MLRFCVHGNFSAIPVLCAAVGTRANSGRRNGLVSYVFESARSSAIPVLCAEVGANLIFVRTAGSVTFLEGCYISPDET